MFPYSCFVSDLPGNPTLLVPAPPFLGEFGEKLQEKKKAK
jgi:hypothetical protein